MHDPIVPAMTENVPKDITMTSETEMEALSDKLFTIFQECANGRPINGGDLEVIEDAAAALSRAPGVEREGAAERLAIVAEKPARLIRWGEGDRLDLQSVLAALSPPSTGGAGEAVAWAMLQRDGSVLSVQAKPYHEGFAQMMATDCGCTVQPLYLHPSPEMGEISREEIARIVDPTAFKQWQSLHDHCVAAGDDAEEARETADWAHKATCDVALEKADQILKLKENGLSREGLGGAQPAPAVRGQGPNPVLTDGPLSDGGVEKIGLPTPLGALKFRMEQGGHTQADLANLIGSRARASEILAGKRALSKTQIRRLVDEWGIPARSLLGPTDTAPQNSDGEDA